MPEATCDGKPLALEQIPIFCWSIKDSGQTALWHPTFRTLPSKLWAMFLLILSTSTPLIFLLVWDFIHWLCETAVLFAGCHHTLKMTSPSQGKNCIFSKKACVKQSQALVNLKPLYMFLYLPRISFHPSRDNITGELMWHLYQGYKHPILTSSWTHLQNVEVGVLPPLEFCL